MKNPIQPLETDADGILRFKRNMLVNALLEHGQATGFGLNELAIKMHWTEGYADDWRQLAQLIGYSLSGCGSLSYVDDATYNAAAAMADDASLTEEMARIATLEEELSVLRAALREPMARLFGIHPDDLGEQL